MGLDVYLAHSLDWERAVQLENAEAICTGISTYEAESKNYTAGIFKVGYFRSSYSPNGFNNRMDGYGLPTLYEIFNIQETVTYYKNIDWESALKNCSNVIDELNEKKCVHKEDLVYCNDALKIIKETIELVLQQPDPQNYRLAWSA